MKAKRIDSDSSSDKAARSDPGRQVSGVVDTGRPLSLGNGAVARRLRARASPRPEVTASTVQSRIGSGTQLPSSLTERFSSAYARDLSPVRIHADNPIATEAGAQALTTGRDLVFGPGRYQPHTAAGDELIGHELAHYVQQSGGNRRGPSPSSGPALYEEQADRAARQALAGAQNIPLNTFSGDLQRREFGPTEDTSNMGPADWKYSDRLNDTERWHSANQNNLLTAAAHEYTQIAQRRDFYTWYYNLMRSRGHEIHWPLAAATVADGALELANRDPAGINFMRSDPLEALLRRGNQVIFDDVLPKLRELYLRPTPLTGQDAQDWDSRILIEEQNLIQPLYNALTPDEMSTFEGLAKQEGFWATVGSFFFGWIWSGQHNEGGWVPEVPDSLDVTRPEDRWRYGMMLAHYFALGSDQDEEVSLAYAMSLPVPTPRAEYTDGSKLAEIDRFAGLHRVTSVMTSGIMDVDELRTAIQGLSREERDVLRRDPWYVAILRHRHGMSPAQAEALLSSEDLTGCTLYQVVGTIESTATVTEEDMIIVMPTAGLNSGWTAHGGTRRLQVQAVSEQAYRLFTGRPFRYVWRDSLRCYPPPRPVPTPRPVPITMTYTVFYDTSNADLEDDSNAGANLSVLNRLLEQLATFKSNTAVERIQLSVIGHASPRWRGANFVGGLDKNYRLSQERAQSARDYVETAYADYEGPVPIIVTRVVTGLPPPAAVADENSQLGLGSAQGLVTTFDADNDEQRFRRTDLHLRVTFKPPDPAVP